LSDKPKPAFKVSVKPEQGGGKAVQLAAFWRKDDGKLRGSLDGKIVQLSVKLEDGTVCHVKRKPDSKWMDHYVNLFEEEGSASKFAGAAQAPSAADDDIFGSPQQSKTGMFDGSGDLDDSEIPF
jgi:hypothetical protein